MSKKEYFAYGSNLNFDQMAYRCPESTVVGTAKLDGYELAFRRGYLTILPKKGASVEGLMPMKYPNKDYIEHLRRKYPPGTRLQLSCMEDEMAVPPGSMGTVDFIDDAGQIHMNWDCGRSLALIPGVDSFSRLPSPKEKTGDAR